MSGGLELEMVLFIIARDGHMPVVIKAFLSQLL
jgi:hypothetical protein